jgi:nitroimidazol reductase NimA-like FMN-containing flavoprotein (pyridoxamine 5'-phosphate oxidase superfamily)
VSKLFSELGEQESRALRSEGWLGRLECCLNGKLYVVPLNHLLEGDSLYIHSLPGLKIDKLRVNSYACLQVDEIKDDFHWRSVLANGHYEEITESQEHDRGLTALFTRLPHLSPAEAKVTRNTPPSLIFRSRISRSWASSRDSHEWDKHRPTIERKD